MIGRTLGHYEILEPLGAGGMGEVYRATDTALKRDVAIKVLPEDLADDPDRLARLEREAHLLASLNHSNIATIHSLEEEHGIRFLVMELVKGETLEKRLATGRLPVDEALDVCRQIAEALEAAHAEGITHRDLKPANVVVTPDGRAKVLDFGLAKATPGAGNNAEAGLTHSPTMTLAGTQAGVILGTAPYMSPEQVRGGAVDKRTDIWAFGCVLFEALAGRRAFNRETVADTLAAIIEAEPDWKALPRSVPRRIAELTRCCLRKDPAYRLHDIADVRIVIEEVSAGRGQRHGVLSRLLPVAAMAIIAAGLAGWALFFTASPPMPTVRPLTSDAGDEQDPALSPDGTMLAFIWGGGTGGPHDLYFKTVDGGRATRISTGARDAHSPAWAPDGREIAFVRRVEDEDGRVLDAVRIVSILPGHEERELDRYPAVGKGLTWSPDGDMLALPLAAARNAPTSIFTISMADGGRTQLTQPPPGYRGDSYPRFSPDGGWVAFIRARITSQEDIWRVRMGDADSASSAEPLTFSNRNTRGLDWAPDGRSIVFSTFLPPQSEMFVLWRIDAAGGNPERLSFGEGAWYPSFARTSREKPLLAYTGVKEDWDIWRLGLEGFAAPRENPIAELWVGSTSWLDIAPSFSPDGNRVAFVSAGSGKPEVYIADADGTNRRRLTTSEDMSTGSLSWSPDGELAFVSKSPDDGTYDIRAVDPSNRRVREITDEPSSNEMAPHWSGDGQWIYFFSDRTGTREIYRQRLENGKLEQLTRNGGTIGRESPDGRYLYFVKSHYGEGESGMWRIPVEGGDEEFVVGSVRGYEWELIDQGIVYGRSSDEGTVFELYDFATQGTRALTAIDRDATVSGMTVSPDGTWILCVVREFESDIMLVEDARR